MAKQHRQQPPGHKVSLASERWQMEAGNKAASGSDFERKKHCTRHKVVAEEAVLI